MTISVKFHILCHYIQIGTTIKPNAFENMVNDHRNKGLQLDGYYLTKQVVVEVFEIILTKKFADDRDKWNFTVGFAVLGFVLLWSHLFNLNSDIIFTLQWETETPL